MVPEAVLYRLPKRGDSNVGRVFSSISSAPGMPGRPLKSSSAAAMPASASRARASCMLLGVRRRAAIPLCVRDSGGGGMPATHPPPQSQGAMASIAPLAFGVCIWGTLLILSSEGIRFVSSSCHTKEHVIDI